MSDLSAGMIEAMAMVDDFVSTAESNANFSISPEVDATDFVAGMDQAESAAEKASEGIKASTSEASSGVILDPIAAK